MDNYGTSWDQKDIELMLELRAKGMSSREIGYLLGRSPAAIDCCLSRERKKAASEVAKETQPLTAIGPRPGFFERIFGGLAWWK